MCTCSNPGIRARHILHYLTGSPEPDIFPARTTSRSLPATLKQAGHWPAMIENHITIGCRIKPAMLHLTVEFGIVIKRVYGTANSDSNNLQRYTCPP